MLVKIKVFLVFFLCSHCLFVSAQSGVKRSPKDIFKHWSGSISASQTEPFHTGLAIRSGDFVYVEVHGQVKIGNYLGNANGVELINPPLFSSPRSYTKYKDFELGALVVSIGSEKKACTQLFRSSSHPIYNAMADKNRMIIDNGLQNYVPGVYMLASTDGTLLLDINDSIVNDNEGSYTVEIFTMSQADHISRNEFNICPMQEPSDDTSCGLSDDWKKESFKSVYYHGLNVSYRGNNKYAGCQCIYDDGTLLTNGKNIGSFDIGFWLNKTDESDAAAKHLHLILDVLPHDLNEQKSGTNDYLGQKTYNCN
jgi:hypothetical protein